jgi:16S rRNA (cytidine1402-2'-O)-methyltransferase
MLYIVPTPIGNLGDISNRAIQVLSECDLILVEDSRVTGRLLQHLGIKKTMASHHSHNEHKTLEKFMDMLRNGQTLSLVSDAGTPGISDPGFLLVRACQQEDIPVTCLPGPTAFVPALVASGLPARYFHFEGFLPHKKGRNKRLEYLARLEDTLILYESPHRLVKTISQLSEFLGPDRNSVVAREISKKFEEFIPGTLSELSEKLVAKNLKGEFVIVVGPKGD